MRKSLQYIEVVRKIALGASAMTSSSTRTLAVASQQERHVRLLYYCLVHICIVSTKYDDVRPPTQHVPLMRHCIYDALG